MIRQRAWREPARPTWPCWSAKNVSTGTGVAEPALRREYRRIAGKNFCRVCRGDCVACVAACGAHPTPRPGASPMVPHPLPPPPPRMPRGGGVCGRRSGKRRVVVHRSMAHLSCGNRPLARCPNQPWCGGLGKASPDSAELIAERRIELALPTPQRALSAGQRVTSPSRSNCSRSM
jgi:hypothetical protein